MWLIGQSAVNSSYATGTVVAWGANDSGQTSPLPSGLTNVVAVAGGGVHSLALKANGTVAAWGQNVFNQCSVPLGLTNVTSIGAGATYSVALKSDGTVTNWGSVASPGFKNVAAIAAGWYHALALYSNGTVAAWGGQTTVPAGLGNIVAVSAGNNFSVAVRSDSTVTAWGDNAYGKTNVPPGLNNVKTVAAGGDHCLALMRDGTVIGWGRNDYGQTNVPANLGPIIAISAGALHSVVLRADGTLFAWGATSDGQTNISHSLGGFIGVAAGQYHNLAIQGDNYPFILLQPFSQNVSVSKDVTLAVTAAGAAPLSYQWQHTCAGCSLSTLTNLPGATNSTLVLTNFQITDGGQYVAVVANSFGSVSSQPALLVPIGGPPVLTVGLTNLTAACGDGVTLVVNVEGDGPFGYQWQFDSNNLDGQTDASLTLTNLIPSQSGIYSVIVTNTFYNGSNFVTGTVTSAATLTVTSAPPTITSLLADVGQQGQPYTYQITALHSPLSFDAKFLPAGLTVDPQTGIISGTPLESGTFGVLLRTFNACDSDAETLVLTITSSAPSIISSLNASGMENQPFSYQIRATFNPTSFGAQSLPVGLIVNPSSGLITGTPIYAGTYFSTISASNQWGVGSATLRITVANAIISGLMIDTTTFTYNYHPPYLLDFTFTLRDSGNNGAIVTSAGLISAACEEDWPYATSDYLQAGWPLFLTNWPYLPGATNWLVNPIAETGVFLARNTSKVIKTYLVLDYSDSVSDPTLNGDSNGDGISDAVDNMVAGAQYFANQQPGSVQIGVYEFHNEFETPNRVIGLTRNKSLVSSSIAGIWTNYVVNYGYGGSRCWDALSLAITALGSGRADEQHTIIFVSDGRDDASVASVSSVIAAARANSVQIFCIAFGINPDLNTLSTITSATRGQLYQAVNPADIYTQFSYTAKDTQAQYTLRWATTRRDTTLTFGPYFTLTYQNKTAGPPYWFMYFQTNYFTNCDNSSPPICTPGTNILVFWRDSIIGPFNINNTYQTNGGWYGPVRAGGPYSGSPTNGLLRLAVDDDVQPYGITLRASYIPQYMRQLKIKYRPNWPCTVSMVSTNSGELLYGWSMAAATNSDASVSLLLSSPDPSNVSTSLPYPGFGPLLTFTFQDILSNPSNAFATISIDNSIYQGISFGGRTFNFETNNDKFFTTNYPAMPNNTPVPWMIQYGLAAANATSNTLALAELADKDGDGMPNWKEYRAGTNPTNSASCFRILPISSANLLPNGQHLITFMSGTNRVFHLDSSTNLLDWQIVQDNIPGNNTNITITDPYYYPGAPDVFYRAVVY